MGKKSVHKQDIMDFLHGLSDIEKSKKKLFTIGVSIALAGIGFFLILWRIASAIDAIFAMRGFRFVLVGIIAVLTGALSYKK